MSAKTRDTVLKSAELLIADNNGSFCNKYQVVLELRPLRADLVPCGNDATLLTDTAVC